MHKFIDAFRRNCTYICKYFPMPFHFYFWTAVFNSCKHITQTNMDSITTHGMCESLIAKPWAQYGQATSIIIIGGGDPWWSRKNEKTHWKIKSQHLVLCDANINKGKGDEEILSSTIIWKLLFSAWSRSRGTPSKGLRSKSLYFPLEAQPVKLFAVSGTKLSPKTTTGNQSFQPHCLPVCVVNFQRSDFMLATPLDVVAGILISPCW